MGMRAPQDEDGGSSLLFDHEHVLDPPHPQERRESDASRRMGAARDRATSIIAAK
jgi:hypothetical protein